MTSSPEHECEANCRVLPIDGASVPRHIAIIMDGNGRWAKRRGLPRTEGHRAGARTVRMVVEEARRMGIGYLTLFAFSTENWQRPAEEVSILMKLFVHYLESELEELLKNGVRLRAIGDLTRLPKGVRELLERNIARTQHLQGLTLVLAISYGGRDEIVRAATRLVEAARERPGSPITVTEESFRHYLDAPDIPDPDLLIRTSDEVRISNFMLWELAYAEIVVSSLLWPEFSKEEFQRCIGEYASRSRRFGRTAEQISGEDLARKREGEASPVGG